MNLWLDDIRDPANFGCIGWHWVKTAEAAIECLKTGQVEKASLDHDLSMRATMGQWQDEITGYHVVCWMEENNVWPHGGTSVHSANPVGKRRMQIVIDRAYRAIWSSE